jgi:hypothetical protein
MVNGGLSDASAIWEKFRDDFCEGLTYTIAQNRLICDPTIDRPDVDYGLFFSSSTRNYSRRRWIMY